MQKLYLSAVAALLVLTLILIGVRQDWLAALGGGVVAKVETDPVHTEGDAADDPAIWIHPTDPRQSLIIGTDKKGGGLLLYDLDGNELQYRQDGEMNNVDLRYNFPLGNQRVALVTASNETLDSISVYWINPQTRRLEPAGGPTISAGIAVYGACMYLSPTTGRYYTFVTSQDGEVEQWELFDNGSGQVEGQLVRSFEVGSQAEGCVADDQLGHFYISEEGEGIWKYGAEPGDGTARTLVDRTGSGGHLRADVEGLSIYYISNGTGYLIASNQGDDNYVVYERQGNNAYVMTFEIVAGGGIDNVTNTDGLDVTNFPLGPCFSQGVLVVHDGRNETFQNFKYVPWESIAAAASPPLTINTSWDPRQVGAAGRLAPSGVDPWSYMPIVMGARPQC